MRKITSILFTVIALVCGGLSAKAQFGCGSAVVLSNGYTASGITTPGTGAPADWATIPTGTSINANYWDDDVYLYQYTAGATSELITMQTFSRNSWNGIGIFETCTGTTFGGELDAMGTTGSNATKTVTAVVDAGQTVYIAIGQWGTPNGLDFDVVSFTVEPLATPDCVVLSTPASGATGVNVEGILTWTGESSAEGYYINLGTTPGGTDVLNNFDAGNVLTYNVPGLLNPNTVYYATVNAYNTVGTATGCTESSFTTGMPPSNDDCASATVLTVNADTSCAAVTAGTTLGATMSMAATPCFGTPDDDVWFSFVATSASHTVTLSAITAVEGTSTDMYFQVLSGSCGTMTSIVCSDPNNTSLTGLTVGSTYYIRVYSYGSTSRQTFNICVGTPPGPPSNDDCAGALPLTVNTSLTCTSVTSGTTLSATESMAATPCFGTPDDDVWFRFTATNTTHHVTISNVVAVTGSSTDMYFQVLSGACGSTISLLCSDNNTNQLSGLTVGDVYYVRVYSYGSTSRNTFDICIGTPPPPLPVPANDDCAGAVALTVNPDLTCTAVTSGYTQSATESMAATPCFGTPDDDVWYSFVATAASHRVSLSNVVAITGTSTDMYFQVLSGACGTQTSVICSDNNSADIGGLTIGTTYYVRVYSYGTSSRNSFDICVATTPAPPANDNFASPIAVACAGSYSGDTTFATLDQDDAPDGFGADMDAPNVWFSFTGSGTAQTVTLNLCNSAYDTSILVYTGTSGALALVAANDDEAACGGALTSRSRVTFTSDGTTTYYIAVEGYNVTSVGAFTMDVTCTTVTPPAVENQTCASAEEVMVDGVPFSSDNSFGTVNATQPSCDTFGTIQDVWFSFVAPTSGSVDLTILNGTMTSSNFNVYSGTCDALVAVAGTCNSNITGTTTEEMTGLLGGNTYYIQAWSSGSEQGTFTMTLSDPSLGVGNFDQSRFNYYPNPVTDVLNIAYSKTMTEASVFNLLGQKVMQTTINAATATLDLSALPSGQYMVRIASDDQVKTIKVIKK